MLQRSKVVAALVLLGTFIGGGAVGVAADHLARVEHETTPADSRTYWDQIGRDWNLTSAQRHVIDSLMDAQRVRITALYRPLRPQWDSVALVAQAISDTTQLQLRTILTPDQRVKLDRMRAEVRHDQALWRARRDDQLAKIR